jgi:hypothetical protein
MRVLPWRSPREAGQSLDADARAALGQVEAALDDVWSTEDPIRSFCAAFERSAPSVNIVVHPGAVDGPPPWTLSTIFRGYRGMLPSNDKLPRFRSYGAYGERATDPFANRPVNLRDLAARVGRVRVEQMAEELFQPIGLFHQLRTVLYDRSGHVRLLAGYYRPRGGLPFDAADHARLHALQPALRRWVDLATAIGFEPLGDGALISAVSAMVGPTVLVRRERVVFANAAARALTASSGVPFAELRARGRTIRLRERGIDLDLLLLPSAARASSGSPAHRRGPVPPYLRPIVKLLREGLADKEIAARLELPTSTARTYVQRVLAHFGVHGRRALMRLD